MAETGRNADALQQEIERTRDELARTVDTITERVHPRNVSKRTVQQVKDDAAATRKRLPGGGGTNNFHKELAHRESESQSATAGPRQAPSGGSHRSASSISTTLGGVGEKLQAHRTMVLASAGIVVVGTVTVVMWRRTRN